INASRLIGASELVVPPRETALGSLVAYITDSTRRDFQPMNANYGLLPPLTIRARDRQKKIAMGKRALDALDAWTARHGLVNASGTGNDGSLLRDDPSLPSGSLNQS
ncbi:MAG TPA: hypothetical protein VN742_07040, partial [Candidatus Binataceae bacterium]|nr:hypothetical protein [Candidatus Binataceae bacterium]